VLADSARCWQQKTTEERKAAICRQYQQAFQSSEALHPLDYIEFNWNAEKFSRGCYVGVNPPLIMTQCREQFASPFGPIHFAGTELAQHWCGYQDGAVESGERAANQVLKELSKQGLVKSPPKFISVEPVDWSQDCVPVELKFSLFERLLPQPSTLCRIGKLLGFCLVAVAVAFQNTMTKNNHIN